MTIPTKDCPVCHEVTLVTSRQCPACGHFYRTQFRLNADGTVERQPDPAPPTVVSAATLVHSPNADARSLRPADSDSLRFDPGSVAGMKRCCDVCGRPLALSAWLTGQRTCDPCLEYRSALESCLKGWPISQQAVVTLELRATQLGLLPEDRLRFDGRAFLKVCVRAADRGSYTTADIQHLEMLASWLHLPANVTSSGIARLRRLSQLQQGPLPSVSYPQLRLLSGERCHWVEQNSQFIEQQTHTERVGGYAGYSMRVCKGMTYRVGSMQGSSYPVTQSVCADTGCFIVTSDRAAFVGGRRSLAIPYKKILSMQVFTNGVQLQQDGARARPQMFTLGDVHAVCIVLTRAMNGAL